MNQNYKQDFSKLKIDNYCRKSSEGEDKQALSIPSQIEEGLEIGRYYNLPKFGEVLHEAKSAKTEYLRPEFARLKRKLMTVKLTLLCVGNLTVLQEI